MTSGARLFGTRAAGVEFMPGARRRAAEAAAASAAPVTAERKRLLAKVAIARKWAEHNQGLLEDDYRQILLEETGQLSARKASDADLVKVIKRFEARGWKATAAGGKKPRPASHPGAGKARALWISLHQLGAIDDPSEGALESFAKRQLHCDRLQFANQSQLFRLIEALKAIGDRHGWDQDLTGVVPAMRVVVLKRRLIEAQFERLKAAGWVHEQWAAARAAFEFGGVQIPSILTASVSELDQVARALGGAVADARKAGALK